MINESADSEGMNLPDNRRTANNRYNTLHRFVPPFSFDTLTSQFLGI